jgi:hypothetical protein
MLQVAGAMDAAAEPGELIAAAAAGDLIAFEHLYRGAIWAATSGRAP